MLNALVLNRLTYMLCAELLAVGITSPLAMVWFPILDMCVGP
jgi:hypothetical protein